MREHLDTEDHNDIEIVLICRAGSGATTAAQILVRSGAVKVSVLEGGMISYINSTH